MLQRLLLLQHRAQQTLPLMRWPQVWETLNTVAAFIGQDEILLLPSAADAAMRLLQIINLLIATGDTLFPSASVFESFAYELAVFTRAVFTMPFTHRHVPSHTATHRHTPPHTVTRRHTPSHAVTGTSLSGSTARSRRCISSAGSTRRSSRGLCRLHAHSSCRPSSTWASWARALPT